MDQIAATYVKPPLLPPIPQPLSRKVLGHMLTRLGYDVPEAARVVGGAELRSALLEVRGQRVGAFNGHTTPLFELVTAPVFSPHLEMRGRASPIPCTLVLINLCRPLASSCMCLHVCFACMSRNCGRYCVWIFWCPW